MRIPPRATLIECGVIMASCECVGLFRDVNSPDFNIINEITAPLAVTPEFFSIITHGLELSLIWSAINIERLVSYDETLQKFINLSNIFLFLESIQYFSVDKPVPLVSLGEELLCTIAGLFMFRRWYYTL